MPDQNSTVDEKLSSLRAEMKRLGVDGFIVPRNDEFQGEYVAPYAERLKFMTGFTGSAGVAVVLNESAAVMSDGRYTIQLEQQVDPAHFETADSMDVSIDEWISGHASAGSTIGYDPRLHTHKDIEKLEKGLGDVQIKLEALTHNPVDAIWDDQPAPPKGMVTPFPVAIAGKSADEKKALVLEQIRKHNAQGCVVTLPDSICWLLNVRGSDIPYIPVALSYLIADAGEERLEWFVDSDKIDSDHARILKGVVEIYDPADLEPRLEALAGRAKASGKDVLMDFQRSPVYIKTALEQADVTPRHAKDPCIDPRAQKSEAEQKAIRQAHIEDGVAMVKFSKWLDDEAAQFNLDEMKVAAKLETFRRENENYKEPSFATISGFAENGAIVHYHATPETNANIDKDGLLLVDSGGQYKWGTTDITRTIAVGRPRGEMRENFTYVLKAHIALARQKFPKGTTGAQIDAITRSCLWNAGLDFAHGTGHGVGCYLSVHEEAASISGASKKAELAPGMLLSNEPGFYKTGAYGIRIENLVLVKETEEETEGRGQKLYSFETITLAPIDRNLIVSEMLGANEKAWLNTYHKLVREKLTPYLDEAHQSWLNTATAAIE